MVTDSEDSRQDGLSPTQDTAPPPPTHTHTASASSRQAWRLSPCCRVLLSCCGSCAAALHVGIRSHASWQCTGGVDVCTDIMSHLKYGEHQELSRLHPQSFLDQRFSSSCIRRIIYLPVLLRWTDCHFWAPGKQVLLINKQLERWLQTRCVRSKLWVAVWTWSNI